MIKFLYGKDTYRSRQELNKIIKDFKNVNKNKVDLKRFNGEDVDFQEFRSSFQTKSIFKENKIIIINPFLSSDLEDKVLKFLKEQKNIEKTEDTIIFCGEGDVKKSSKLFKFLIKKGESKEFKPLKEKELKDWITEKIKGSGAKIKSEAINLLVNFVGNNLWQLSNEIEKLISYNIGQKNPEIKLEDVNLLVRPKIETNIFKTIDAISLKDKKTALSLVHDHLEKGDSPIYLFSMIKLQIKNLLIVKDLSEKGMPFNLILSDSKLHPFVARKSYRLSYKFTFKRLKEIYWKIFKLDIKIKTGKIEPSVALDLLASEI